MAKLRAVFISESTLNQDTEKPCDQEKEKQHKSIKQFPERVKRWTNKPKVSPFGSYHHPSLYILVGNSSQVYPTVIRVASGFKPAHELTYACSLCLLSSQSHPSSKVLGNLVHQHHSLEILSLKDRRMWGNFSSTLQKDQKIFINTAEETRG